MSNNIIDLFSGVGGLSRGFELEGFNIVNNIISKNRFVIECGIQFIKSNAQRSGILKVEVNLVKSYEEERANIYAVEISEHIQSAIDILKNNCEVIYVISDEGIEVCKTESVYYIESVDNKTYLYTKNSCYEIKHRLYELETILNCYFLRCSKSMILNMKKIKSVKSEINGRMIATLLNGEKVIITRSYVKNLKQRLGI